MVEINRRKDDNRLIVFDRTINVGNLLAIAIFIISIFQMYSGIISRMDKMEFKVDAMWQVFKIEVGR